MSIEVAGVTRFFGSTRAVWNMSMTVPAGYVTGLVDYEIGRASCRERV